MKPVTGPTVSPVATVVIPAYDAEGYVGRQLRALADQTGGLPIEVVVADNGSTDATKERARAWRHRFAGLLVVDASDRRGPGHARNVGAAAATAPLLLFCDADDVVSPTWVGALVEALGRWDMAGGPYDVAALNPRWVTDMIGDFETTALPSTLRYLPYAFGGCVGVRREAFEAVGGFDLRFLGHEEADLAWRVQESGRTLGFAPEAVVHYRLRTTTGGLLRQRYASGLTNVQLQAAYRRPGMPPLTLRRQVRVLLDQLRAVTLGPERGTWLLTTAWAVGRVVGWARYGRRSATRGQAPADPAGGGRDRAVGDGRHEVSP